MATWSNRAVLDFIDLYHSHECLWKVKSKDYKNKFLRENAYQDLISYCRGIDEYADKDFVTKKINSLRRELNKHLRSKASGSERVYETSLWYYPHLLFLKDQETPKSRCFNSNIITAKQETTSSNQGQTGSEDFEAPSPCAESEVSSSPERVAECPLESPSSSSRPTAVFSKSTPKLPKALRETKPAKRKSDDSDADERLLKAARLRLLNPAPVEDRHDVFGKNVAHKLRIINQEQRVHAEKLISDVLYEAELGSLSRKSSVVAIPRESVGAHNATRAREMNND